jgi:hypothetical protein
MDKAAFAELRRQILAARGVGVTHVLLERVSLPVRGDLVSVIDAAVASLGFQPISTSWREISSSEAVGILRNILNRDLAYNAEIMPGEVAQELAERFCALFPQTARYFTNGGWRTSLGGEAQSPVSWQPLTDATFDAGIVAVGNGYLGVAWVEDED